MRHERSWDVLPGLQSQVVADEPPAPLLPILPQRQDQAVMKRLIILTAITAPLLFAASAQALTPGQAAERATLYFQSQAKAGSYNPSSFYWNCEPRSYGWACSTFVVVYAPYCQPPAFDGHAVASVRMNHRGTGRRLTRYACSRLA